MSIRPLRERTRERGPDELPQIENRARTGPAALAPEALVIHTLTSAKPLWPRPEDTNEIEHVSLEEERLEHTVQLGRDITTFDRQSLLFLLREYKDVFVFGPDKMPCIAPNVMEHRLNVDSHHKPIIQKKRHMGPKRATTANAEVQKLLEAGFT